MNYESLNLTKVASVWEVVLGFISFGGDLETYLVVGDHQFPADYESE